MILPFAFCKISVNMDRVTPPVKLQIDNLFANTKKLWYNLSKLLYYTIIGVSSGTLRDTIHRNNKRTYM